MLPTNADPRCPARRPCDDRRPRGPLDPEVPQPQRAAVVVPRARPEHRSGERHRVRPRTVRRLRTYVDILAQHGTIHDWAAATERETHLPASCQSSGRRRSWAAGPRRETWRRGRQERSSVRSLPIPGASVGLRPTRRSTVAACAPIIQTARPPGPCTRASGTGRLTWLAAVRSHVFAPNHPPRSPIAIADCP